MGSHNVKDCSSRCNFLVTKGIYPYNDLQRLQKILGFEQGEKLALHQFYNSFNCEHTK